MNSSARMMRIEYMHRLSTREHTSLVPGGPSHPAVFQCLGDEIVSIFFRARKNSEDALRIEGGPRHGIGYTKRLRWTLI